MTVRPMARRLVLDASDVFGIRNGSREILRILQRGVEGVPIPILGEVLVIRRDQVAPGVDFDFGRANEIHSVDC